jgi:hypothetical protein
MSNVIRLSNSEIQTFKDCRRRWWLTYYRSLKPRNQDFTGALALGSRIHAALDDHYAKGVPLSRDVAVVINSFKPFKSSVPEAESAAPAKPTLPTSKASSLGSASSGRQAAPAPAATAIAQTRAQADAAIKQGVSREAVAKRFKETTGQDY